MPKLKKHSQRYQSPPEQLSLDQKYQVNETQAEEIDKTLENSRPIRLKYSDRKKLITEKQSKRKSKRIGKKEQQQKNDEYKVPELKEDKDIDQFLNKYGEDDIDVGTEERITQGKREKKQVKPQIKTRNKMFSKIEIKETLMEIPPQNYQQLEISVQRRERKQGGQLLQKIQKKAAFCMNKLEYKELHKDYKYKKDMKDKLKEISEVEEVNITVAVPKLWAGNRSEVQTALFLKNTKEGSTQQVAGTISQKEEDENSQANVDRRTYYDELGKKLRLKKTETFTECILKERFKKSQLQDTDYIEDLNQNHENSNNRFNDSNYSRRSFETRQRQRQNSLPKRDDDEKSDVSMRQSKNERLIKNERRISDLSKGQMLQVKQDKNQEQIDDSNPIGKKISLKNNSKTNLDEDTPAEMIPTQNIKNIIKPTRKKYKANKNIAKYIEQQAEVSDDDQNKGKTHRQQDQSESEDDTNLDSLIDDDVQINPHYQKRARQRFVKDMMEEEERRYQQLRKKVEMKYKDEEQKLKKRMEEAAKKNKIQDNQNQVFFVPQTVENEQSLTTSTAKKAKNQLKFKDLDAILGVDKKTTIEVTQPSSFQTNKLQDLENAIFGKPQTGIRKVERKGLANSKMVHKKPIRLPARK